MNNSIHVFSLGGSGAAIARDVDWNGDASGWKAEEVVDIGGGYGELLAEILTANPLIAK